MAPDFVRNTVNRKPFRPFAIHLAGGRSIRVPSPECIQVPTEGRMIIVSSPNHSTHIIDLLLVTDLEFLNTSMLD
jgi:hypothetical protein